MYLGAHNEQVEASKQWQYSNVQQEAKGCSANSYIAPD